MKALTRSVFVTVFFCGAFAANATSVLYSNLPSPLPYNSWSHAFEATSSTEFGGLINLATAGDDLTGATVLMSNWAPKSLWTSYGDTSGYNVPLTLNIYNVGAGDTVGSLLATDTVDAFIRWKPEATGCDLEDGYNPGDGGCYHGFITPVSFKFNYEQLPGQVIFGLSFNTTDYGNPPTHVAGPYDSLNFALSTSSPTAGSNPLPDSAYVNTTWAGFYSDGGAGGVGTFRQDTGWSEVGTGAIQLTGTPEPTTCILLGGGLLAMSLIRRRRRA
jgi:hypothetical protein